MSIFYTSHQDNHDYTHDQESAIQAEDASGFLTELERLKEENARLTTQLSEKEKLHTQELTQCRIEARNAQERAQKDARHEITQFQAKFSESFIVLYNDLKRFYEYAQKIYADQPHHDMVGGLNMLLKKASDLLAKHDIALIEAQCHEPFDAQYHEAIGVAADCPSKSEGFIESNHELCVGHAVECGYTIKGMTKNPAKVVVRHMPKIS